MTLAKPLASYLNRRLWNRISSRVKYILRKAGKDDFADQKFLFSELPVDVIFDVGANIGFVTKRYQRDFPTAEIYSFEPNPSVFEVLHEQNKDKPKIHTYPYAISNQDSMVTFLLNKKSGSSSLFQPTEANRNRFYLSEPQPTTVQAVTIDGFCQKEAITKIDILKLDIEGAEIMALEGATQMLRSGNIGAIYSEVAIVAMYENHQLFHHIVAFLQQYDYQLYNVYELGESPRRQAIFGNAIFVGEKLRQRLEDLWGKASCGW